MDLIKLKDKFKTFMEDAEIKIETVNGKYVVYERGDKWVCGPIDTIDELDEKMENAEIEFYPSELDKEELLVHTPTDEETEQSMRDNWRI